jgi:hypothetical protein
VLFVVKILLFSTGLRAEGGHDFAREKVEGSLAGVARNARD